MITILILALLAFAIFALVKATRLAAKNRKAGLPWWATNPDEKARIEAKREARRQKRLRPRI